MLNAIVPDSSERRGKTQYCPDLYGQLRLGEPGFNGGGIIRGAATPELDKLADEGLRLTNFNVEAQCTPSRSAILTGRYAIRSGNGVAPLGGGVYGLV
jgi:arylsulfatase